MSINRKLGDLANVLDDGTEGQVLSFNASGAIAASDIAAGASVYDSAELLPLTGLSAGDMAYVTGTNRFYISNGTGWYSVSLVNTNPSITSVQDSDGGTTPFTLTTDGTATVITVTASDPEDVPLTYNYSVTAGSLTNGGGTTATVSQADNVFTVTPSTTEAYAGTFSLTFTASDGINTDTSANTFTLEFITTVTNSKYTTLLATAVDTSDNNNITDASSNSHSITVNGDAHAGTFSPYRSGGYSILFDNTTAGYSGSGSFSIRYASGTTSDFVMGTNAFTIEGWIKPYDTGSGSRRFYQNRYSSTGNGKGSIFQNGSNLYMSYRGNDGIDYELGPYSVLTANTWTHFCLLRNTSDNTLKLYADGTLLGSVSVPSSVSIYGSSSNTYIGDGFGGEMANIRVINGTALAPPAGGPTVKPENVTNTVLLLTGPNLVDYSGIAPIHNDPYAYDTPTVITSSPYDYSEYDAADHGGSVYFDGSGDTLEIPHSTNVGAFGTNDFTVQMWYYTDVVGSQDYLIDFRQYGGNGDYLSIYKNGSNKIVVAEGGSDRIIGTKNISVGQWFFITVHRDNGSLKLFVNGEQDGSTYSDSTNYVAGSSGNFIIGKNNGSAGYLMEGYLSDIRVTHGSALDGTTVPTAPLSSSGAELHLKGTDASIIDKSQGANLKLIGGPTGSTTQAKFANTKSIDFGDGSQTYVMEVSSGAGYIGEFTIEFWMYNTFVTSTWQSLISNSYVSGSEYFRLYKNNGSGAFALYHNSTSAKLSGIGTIANNTWTHVAIVRDSSNDITVYQDGISIGSYNNNQVFGTASSPVNVGKGGVGDTTNYPMSGYIQDLRITDGLARYTANFTPPTASLEG